MSNRVQSTTSEFTPQIEEIRAMAHQDMAFARERLAEGRARLGNYLVREPVKTLVITLCVGIVLGWLIRRP